MLKIFDTKKLNKIIIKISNLVIKIYFIKKYKNI